MQDLPTEDIKWAPAAEIINENFKEVGDFTYCDYSKLTPYELTSVSTIITDWTANATPLNITHDSGVFTVNKGGVYTSMIERIYRNNDNNPSLIVNVTILIEILVAGQSTWVPLLNRTLPISSATANDEPGILPFTTPFTRPITAGTKFRVSVSAEDNGADPQSCWLESATITTNRIAPISE